VLVYLNKNRADEEEFLFIKLIGYYLLGAFRFNFNEFPLPAGFAVYLLFFRPTLNTETKKIAAYMIPVQKG
jgi:di/tricarboxylate transporter